MSQNPSSTQLLSNALKQRMSSQQLAQAHVNIIPLISKNPDEGTFTNACESSSPKNKSKISKESSRALMELLVIPQHASVSTPIKMTYSQSMSKLSTSKIHVKPSKVSNVVKESCISVTHKEKKCKLSKDKEKTKSRSNSEDAEFYASSAILNSPNPNAVPMPDFDESSDFFSFETRYHIVENLDGSLAR